MRGDSNMSDSRFMKSQKDTTVKNCRTDIDKFDKEYRIREMRRALGVGKR